MTSSRRLALVLALPLFLFATPTLHAQSAPEGADTSSAAQPVPTEQPAAPLEAPAPSIQPQAPDIGTATQPPVTPVDAKPINPKDVTLKVASRGAAYRKSQQLAYFRPFTQRKGYNVSAVQYDGSLAALRAQSGSPVWDVVDLDQETAVKACEEQLLEPLDASIVQPGPDGTSPLEDFLPGGIQPCSVASVAWSAVIVFDKGLKTQPTKLEHVFDIRRYPGKRALPRTPQYTLELALLADDVAPGQVYEQLATKEGQDRAFAKLTAIKEQIVWWARAQEATEKIAQKQAAMGLAFNGRAFAAIVQNRQPLGILWDHQMYHLNYWAIPKGAKHAGPAKEFIGFATSAGQLADQTRWIPYGPARASAVRIAGKHAELDMDMKPYLPTHQPNLQGALAFNAVWWASQDGGLKARFEAWVEGRELPPVETNSSQ